MKNKLDNLAEFKQILSSYKISDDSKGMLNSVSLLLLASPTAIGRNTIINELVKSGDYHYIVSDTTRLPRINDNIEEVNGVEYWFKNEKEVLEGLKAGKYLEAAIIHDQQVSGISINELAKARSEHKTAVTDIEVQGVNTIKSYKPDAHAIFLLPPSFEEWMYRLDKRGDMHLDEKNRRLNSALFEFDFALNSGQYVYLINDHLPLVIEKLNKVVLGGPIDPDDQQKAKLLMSELCRQTEDFLKNN